MKRCWVTRLDSVGSFGFFPRARKCSNALETEGKTGPISRSRHVNVALHLGQRSAARAWWARGSR